MSTPSFDGSQDPLSHLPPPPLMPRAQLPPGRRTGQIDRWTAVLEFARPDDDPPFAVADVESLIECLGEWHPSALWNSDRYAIQLEVPATAPHMALQWALAYHLEAARTVGLPTGTLVRVEMSTLAELERALREYDPAFSVVDPPAPQPLLCDELYLATRSLHAATTPEELTETLVAFVSSFGARVNAGAPPNRAGRTELDLSLDSDGSHHATAESMSVAGLVIEQALPTLVGDARIALARLQGHHIQGTPPPPAL